MRTAVLALSLALATAFLPEAVAQETFGAPAADALGPVGGGKGYANTIAKGDFSVKTALELLEALEQAKPGQVVYVDGDTEIDMTVLVTAYKQKLVIPAGVTLAGSRGREGSEGALICSDEFQTEPLIEIGGENVRISGLRLRGPDTKVRSAELGYLSKGRKKKAWNVGKRNDNGDYYRFPTSTAVNTQHPGLVVDNCEIWGWSHAGVYGHTREPSKRVKIHVHHCNIHHCQRAGLGYGVCVGDGCEALVEANLFDYTRHAIAGTGRPGTCYEARNNAHGEHAVGHLFDMHGSVESGGVKWDGHNIAGEWIRIHHNTFRAPVAAVVIRGLPREGCEIHHNWFFTEPADHSVRQVGGEQGNMKVYDNVAGEEKRPWTYPAK